MVKRIRKSELVDERKTQLSVTGREKKPALKRS